MAVRQWFGDVALAILLALPLAALAYSEPMLHGDRLSVSTATPQGQLAVSGRIGLLGR